MRRSEFLDGEPGSALPIPRATIEDIVARRNRTLSLYNEAFEAWSLAKAAMIAAAQSGQKASNDRFTYHLSDEAKALFIVNQQPDRDTFAKHIRRLTDTDVWAHIVEMTTLERLMDRKAKEDLHRQLVENPPEVTVENVHATLEQFLLDADMIWKRGIATCFSSLDRRFKTHDGWKIGSRVILSYAFNDSGRWNYHSKMRDVMTDIERAFLVLDGRSPTSIYQGIVAAVENDRRHTWEPRQSVTEGEFFKICVYKNGNAHVWFKRDDLVDKVNKLLGEYYDAPIPEEREAAEDDGLGRRKTSIAKGFAFYPTPPDVAADVVDQARLWRSEDEAPFTVLEPSAGSGNLARLCVEKGAIVDCVEVHPGRAVELEAERQYRRVIQSDFLALQPDPDRLYDRVVMNPPFDGERDIDHVLHAMKFLKPGGRLVAIMSAGTEFRETRKATTFREIMTEMRADWHDLPPASFASVGTYINTLTVSFWKRAE